MALRILALGVCPMLACSAADGAGGTGGSRPPSAFAADPPVTVSGPSPTADCREPVPEGWEDAETEAWIAVNPLDSDHLAGIWMQDSSSRRALVAALSFDGGASWESVIIPGLTLCSGGDWPTAADPWLAFAANGDLYASSLPFEHRPGEPPATRIMVSKSNDGGRTWGPPTTIVGSQPPFTDDKESITAHPLDECSAYVTWTQFVRDRDDHVMSSRTTDCGETWTLPQIVHTSSPGGIAAQLVVLPDGTLLDFFKELDFDLEEHPIYVKRSIDGGQSWTEAPIEVARMRAGPPVTPDGGERVRSGFFDVAIDRESGFLVAVWEQFVAGVPPVSIAFSSSLDAGATWSPPIRIDRTPDSATVELEQAFLPSVEMSDDGTIGVTYYSFENDTPGDSRADCDHWFVHCHPGLADCTDPQSWSKSVRLTPSSFDYHRASRVASGANPGLFLGDYVGLSSSGSDFFALFSVTTDDDPADVVFVKVRGR